MEIEMQNSNNKTMDDILRDTQHNAKANQVFLKLIAKHKKQANPFDKVRSQTQNPSSEIKQGVGSSDTN